MKQFLALLTLSIYLNASEFAYIQPVAVETAQEDSSAISAKSVDSDGDGILDDKDKCPNTKEGEKTDALGCMLKKDADKDGIANESDKCPKTPQDAEVNERGCELDSDNDGIANSKDQCPDTSEEFLVDGYGCPQAATLKVNFASNKYDVSDELIDDLKNFAQFLQDNTGYQVVIFGYTDNSGDSTKNKKLSQHRANAVKEALIRYGIKYTRLTAIGKGDADPISQNETKDGRAKNRRIEVELIR